ncbi:50S ribosomal protein L25/general stress protein Ctc [Pacificimonas flava]|uniref:Large ribosomal subunit protein bL25 n=2 Tax=Pacificimonas TaxID=1960290 RepID=A0A219B8J9_9SPHN|nr:MULTISPECIES: 50S ribosomal protein L25/general stress protein Ctc [Pacificimonas]MBZ6377235.1 50S ribosomal protein L25/general stress protein Ctc [Pacificimonas aurantium]OWV34657.1 50S ribosomal protein L25/general stress protein Ctc [Pacificimonas flava]
MSDAMTIAAQVREKAGKGASRAMRREGRVPAVIYGDKKDPISVHVEEKVLMKLLQTGHFLSSVVMVEVEGGDEHRTLPKDVQLHPVTDRPVHVDFLRLKKGQEIAVNVPLQIIDEESSPGLERGGVLNVVRHELEVHCRPSLIPESITVSVDGLQVGDSVHISEVTLPEGVRVDWGDHDFTVLTIVAPSAMKSEEDEAEDDEEEVAADEVPTTEQDADIDASDMDGKDD